MFVSCSVMFLVFVGCWCVFDVWCLAFVVLCVVWCLRFKRVWFVGCCALVDVRCVLCLVPCELMVV